MNVGTVAAEAPTPTYDAATGNSAAAAVGSSPRARRSLDMGGGRRAAPVLPDFEGDVDHFVLPASARGSVMDFLCTCTITCSKSFMRLMSLCIFP